ncbi:MAG: hypothetical protein GQ582_03175, partial [Methyloprofundus sp.]|nr:hypothetical protein [Methyloprofundus sp.]
MKLLTAGSYAILALPLLVGNVQANPSETKMFGAAAPFTINNLPASRLKDKLESLPAPAQQKAMKWLHSFNFPEQDIEFLKIDNSGAVIYHDTVLPEETNQVDLESNPSLEGINPVDAFKLHSKPGAANVVYVNFKGHTITGTGWNNGGPANYYAKPFNTDADINSFSDAERVKIADVWHRIAEDLAPFDIDVTTELPVDNNGNTRFGPKVGHILVTSKWDASGAAMPYNSGGGVAYVGTWGLSNYEFYQPALVYYDSLSSSSVNIAEAAAHEFGHNLGLSHDGTSTVGYYRGHGTGLTSWAPIMGVGYYNNVTQWSKGEYADANNTEDDLAIIGGKLNYRNDDHASALSAATPLSVDANGFLASSTPEFDPANQRPDNKGTISGANDVDSFYFDTAAGFVDLNIIPAWNAFTNNTHRGSNTDLRVTLYNDSGVEIVSSDPIDDTAAFISENLAAGRYYVSVTAVANTASPYSDYASLGQYYISGVIAPTTTDTLAPNPDPMGLVDMPVAMNKTSISMTSVIASDASGVVEYQFICTSGGAGCVNSAWQSEASYTAMGLEAETEYSFQVKARDAAANETAVSSSYSTTTLANVAPECMSDYEIVDQNTATFIDVLANDTEFEGEALQIYSTSVAT